MSTTIYYQAEVYGPGYLLLIGSGATVTTTGSVPNPGVITLTGTHTFN